MGSLENCTLVIRADADAQLGAGHVMRCLGIGQEWASRGGRFIFVSCSIPAPLGCRVRDSGGELVQGNVPEGSLDDASVLAATARDVKAAVVLVDGYRFDAGYYRRLRDLSSCALVSMDDGVEEQPLMADLYINGNPAAEAGRYAGLRACVGASYTLIRQEFRSLPSSFAKGPIPYVLVTTGGGEPRGSGLTEKLVRGLWQGLGTAVRYDVVLGGAQDLSELRREHLTSLGEGIEVSWNVADMPMRMARCEFAVAGAGGTTWELAFLGVASLLVTVASNQERNVMAAVRGGIALALGRHEELSEARIGQVAREIHGNAALRMQMSHAGRRWLDGRGASRVVDAMVSLSGRSERGVGR